MAAALLTLAQAKAHLKITLPALDPGDADIQLKLDQAEMIILDYLKSPPIWSASTVPGPVSAAILLMLGRLFEHRGDLEEEDANLWLAVERLLMRYRDPALA